MVHLITPEVHCLKNVKLEVQDSGQHQLAHLHTHIHKRPKLDSPLQWTLGDDSFPIPPPLGLYNPLHEHEHEHEHEPSPLGLRLRKSPSLLDLIQMTLSQQDNPSIAAVTVSNIDHKASATTIDPKLKASNFPATILKIGTWEYNSRYEGDLMAKCYFAKHKLVWEVLDGCLKNKIEIPWSDIMHLKANYPEDGPGTLEVLLARRPVFFREINPQPRKHTLWEATPDFTGGQASIQRRHFLQFPQGLLGKHFEKLVQCDPRLNFLSQQSDLVLDCPYFEPRTAMDDQMESSDGFDRKSEEQAGFFGSQDVESGSAVQSSSSKSEHNLVGRAVENVSQEITSPSSVMDTHAIKDFRSTGADTLKFLRNLDQIKLPGLHPSMSMTDLVSHIEHCISEQMASGNPDFTGDIQHSRSVLEELSQYLFNDSQLTTAADEQFVMSRVNSLCCLLQKDPSTAEDTMIRSGNGLDADDGEKVGESNSAQMSSCKSKAVDFEGQQDDASGCKKETAISRKESVGDLLLNLPRIASLPQFLFHLSDDSVNQVR